MSTQSIINEGKYFADLSRRFEPCSLEALLQWSLDSFGDKIAQVTSFGPTGMVLLDHLAKLKPGIRVITIDTDFLFEETYDLWEQVQRRYPIQLEIHKSALTPQAQTITHGDKLWQTDPDQCCYIRKVIPLRQALQGLDGWYTGLRRDQSPTRKKLPLVMWDDKYELVKLNPLASWTRSHVWQYILDHDIPYNPLHDHGYQSIGCTHCTQTTLSLSDERAGRWAGFAKTECGIHI